MDQLSEIIAEWVATREMSELTCPYCAQEPKNPNVDAYQRPIAGYFVRNTITF